MFTPALGVNIEVTPIEYGSFNVPKCEDCKAKWENSKILDMVAKVKWQLLKEKMDVMQLVCGLGVYMCVCVLHILCHRIIVCVDWGMPFVPRTCMDFYEWSCKGSDLEDGGLDC